MNKSVKVEILLPRINGKGKVVRLHERTHTRLVEIAAKKKRPIYEIADILINQALDHFELIEV